MADVREDILARLLVVVATIPNIRSAQRNNLDITENQLPAAIVFDGDEDTNEAAIEPPSNKPIVVQMTPEIIIAQQADEVGSDLTTLRRELIKRVLPDTELNNLRQVQSARQWRNPLSRMPDRCRLDARSARRAASTVHVQVHAKAGRSLEGKELPCPRHRTFRIITSEKVSSRSRKRAARPSPISAMRRRSSTRRRLRRRNIFRRAKASRQKILPRSPRSAPPSSLRSTRSPAPISHSSRWAMWTQHVPGDCHHQWPVQGRV